MLIYIRLLSQVKFVKSIVIFFKYFHYEKKTWIMKKILIIGALFFSLPIVLHSFSTINIIRKEIKTSERISFKIRGTGSKNMLVTILALTKL